MTFESIIRGTVAVTIFAAAAAEMPAQTATATELAKQPAIKYDPNSHFGKRMVEIEKDLAELPAETTGTIVMVGDSITEHFFRKEVMPDSIHGIKVLNQGISGDQVDRPTSGTGVTHRMEQIKRAKPAVVFVMIGINDFWGGKEKPEQVIPQYEKMFSMLKETVPGARIVVQSVLPSSQDKANLNPYVDQSWST
jgi:predicted MPP superfamily phosphohydrolase